MTQTAAVTSNIAIPLPPPPPPAGHITPIQPPVQPAEDTNKQPSSTKPQPSTNNRTISVDGKKVPAALASAFAQDKVPFSYFEGELQLGTTPSIVRRKDRQANNVSRGPKVLPIVTQQQLDETSNQQPQQPPQVLPQQQQQQQSVHAPQPSIEPQVRTSHDRAHHRPINFTPISYTSSVSNCDDMPSVQHLQYNSPAAIYSYDNAANAFEQQTRGIETGFGTTPTPQPRPEWQASQSATYKAIMETEEEERHGGRPTTPHSAKMVDREAQGDVYSGHYHGYVGTGQSPSFRKLQMYTNAGEQSEANQCVAQYEQQQLQGGQQGQQGQQGQRPLTPTVVAAQPPPQHSGVPAVAQYNHGIEERPIDHDLAGKLNAAERPNVPTPVVPSWAQKANVKHGNWQQAQGYDPRREQESRQYVPEEPMWAKQSRNRPMEDRWEQHYGYITGSPRPRSTTPGAPQRGYDMGGQDYCRTTNYNRALSVEPTNAGWRMSPRGQGLSPRAPHQHSVSAAANEWLKPYVAPNVRGFDRHQNYGTVISNVDKLGTHARCDRQDLCNIGTYFGARSGQTHGQEGYGRQGGYGAQQQQQLGHKGFDVSTDYRNYVPAPISPSQARIHQERQRNIMYAQQAQEAYNAQGGGQGGVDVQSGLQVNTAQNSAHMPPADGLSPHQREMGTNFLGTYDGHAVGEGHKDTCYSSNSMQQRSSTYSSLGRQGGTSTNEHTWAGGNAPMSTYRSTPVVQSAPPPQNYAAHQRSTPVPSQSALNQSIAPLAGSNTQISQWHTQQGPNWYSATGGCTKASTSGDYIDGEGNKVHYTKQLYQNNDPGNECSTLTEEERKVMEEPLQPGVISRHVTTKYYKKSTYANQQSSSTTMQATPQTPRVRVGEVKPGLTQF